MSIALTTEKGSCNGCHDPSKVHHKTELVSSLGMGTEGVKHSGENHADLVTANDDSNDSEVLKRTSINSCQNNIND